MADELKACLKSSYLWNNVENLFLKTNMRAHLRSDKTAGQFAEQLMKLGDGKLPTGLIKLKMINLSINFCNIVDSTEELKTYVFPNIRRDYNNHK